MTFRDDFAADDPARWIQPSQDNWPPRPGTPGTWARCYYTGWPWKGVGEDNAARTLGGNHEAQSYEDSGVGITSEGLILTATRGTPNHFNMPWTSGVIVQNRDLAFKYGYFEIVMQAPKEAGFWPGFWALPVALGWTGELDFLEMLGSQQRQVHVGFTGQDSGAWSKGTWLDLPFVISEGMHKYGCLWTEDTVTWFADDVEKVSYPTPDALKQPMHIIANLAVGGPNSWPGEPAIDVSQAVMKIRRIIAMPLGSWTGTKIPVTDLALPTKPPAEVVRMPNPAITKIDFATGAAVLYTADPRIRYTFPIVNKDQLPAVAPIVVDNTPQIAALSATLDLLNQRTAELALLVRNAPLSGGAPSPGPAPATLNTTFPAGWTELTCTPGDKLAAAVAVAAKGFKLHLAPGRYPQVFHIPAGLDGWTIDSVSGNADDVTLDGQGGATRADNDAGRGDTRLAYGKGVVHAGCPGTLIGVTVTGGGTKAVNDHDGQAGLYWDCNGGMCAAVKCHFTGNQNGVFGNGANTNVQYVLDHCGFDNNGNDGGSHDTYMNGDAQSSLTITECHAEGSNAGNNFKCRIPKVTINGGWHGSKNNNRWLDCADGGYVDIHGGTFVGSDTGQNVFANGDESTSKGPGNTTWDDSTIYLGNRGQNFDNAGNFTGTNLTVYPTGGNSSILNAHGGPLPGLADKIGAVTAPPAPPPAPYLAK